MLPTLVGPVYVEEQRWPSARVRGLLVEQQSLHIVRQLGTLIGDDTLMTATSARYAS